MKTIFIILLSFMLVSCLENDIATLVSSINLETSELFLREFESNGDYINSNSNPALIEASEVYNNLDSYLLIDIRSADEFSLGRIKNSKNVKADSLIRFIEKNGPYNFAKVVIISSTGQHAAFCTSILRLLNYQNVFSMNFGMAAWNKNFSEPWETALKTEYIWFTHNNYVKASETPLPQLPYTSVSDVNGQILRRAEELLAMEFDEICSDYKENELTIAFQTIDYDYYTIVPDARGNPMKDLSDDVTLICYSDISLYFVNNRSVVKSHPRETILYLTPENNESDLRSDKFLQTIPSNEKVFIYSYSGQRSAYLTAYLRMLGYQAKSMVFGTCNILYTSMLENPDVSRYAFKQSDINGYSYESN